MSDTMIRDFFVDLTTLGDGFTGVSVFAGHIAAYLEKNFKCKVLAPPYLTGRFQNAIICPEPIYFKRGLVCRRPYWRRHSSIDIRNDSFVYAPHMHGLIDKCRQVSTIHDMIHNRFPTRNIIENTFNSYILPRIVHRCSGIVTVSQTSRAEIAKYFNIDESKIAIVANGLDLVRWTPATIPIRTPEPQYLLAVSANRPYKNTIELIQNHDLWSKKFRLRIVSSRTRYGKTIRQAISAARLDHVVDFLDDLSEEALVDLYRNSAAVVYPSLLEGFGRPALEAMSVGRPVILSNISVHRELFSGAAIFITPGDRASWAAAFNCLDNDSEVRKLVAAGLALAQTFGWDRVGHELSRALLMFEPGLADLQWH